jgi:hypothetical protein
VRDHSQQPVGEDRHGVSANASETQPAKLLAVFVLDTNETELTIPLGN